MKITKDQAKHFLLLHHKLVNPRSLKGKDGILKYISQVGCIQYDPLDTVGYNPYLVLQSRIKNFKPELLTALLYHDRRLLDGWDKNMAIYLIDDWPFFSRFRKDAYKRYGDKAEPITKILSKVRNELSKKGPLSSIDLKFDTKVDWGWAPTRAARAALESMYFWGELIIHHKIGTRKVYDFTKKHIPEELISMIDPNDTDEKYFEWNVKRRIGAVGLLWSRGSDAWLGIKGMKTKERSEAIMSLERKGEIIQIEVEDINYSFYIRKEDMKIMNKVIEGIVIKPQAAFIAPLDNILWDRKLIKELFGFEYIWEVYKPISQRRYGYYVLPVIYGDRFIARFEPKFNKKTGILQIINWWWEKDVDISQEMEKALKQCFEEFMSYLGAVDLKIIGEEDNLENLKWIEKMVE